MVNGHSGRAINNNKVDLKENYIVKKELDKTKPETGTIYIPIFRILGSVTSVNIYVY